MTLGHTLSAAMRGGLVGAAALLAGCAVSPMDDDAMGFGAACDRACLEATAEAYLVAMAAHDPALAPFAPDARYTENGVELLLPDGLWRTTNALDDYRLYVADPGEGAIGFFSVVEENGVQALVSTRLQVVDQEITEAETMVARFGDGALFQPEPGSFDAPRPQFLQTLPPERRRPRDAMIDIANSYFSALENNDGSDVPPFADDCHRLENGFATANRPVAEGQTRGPLNMSCAEAFGLGYYREDTRLRDRRFLAVDEERGLVFAAVYFDHDAALREYQLTNGETRTVTRTAPWTWMIHEIFQIEDGMISQVEAVLLGVPYGMRPNWDTGVTRPSPTEEAEIAAAARGL